MIQVKHHLQYSELHRGMDACRIEVLMQRVASSIEFDMQAQ
jgi:hypothetical protein